MKKEEQKVIMTNLGLPMLAEKTQFTDELFDLDNNFDMNGSPMNRAVYNLMVSKRDISLYVLNNMKPHRNWYVTDIKKYFGIKGNGQKLLDRFLALVSEYEELMKVSAEIDNDPHE